MIEFKIFLYDKKLEDLGVKTTDMEAMMSIRKDKIYGIRERMNDEGTELSNNTCFVYTDNETFVVGLAYSEVIKLAK